ncbi:MAG: MazE family transcriptional regulator [Bdellovibrionales bacterium RIFOXYD1_FULL_53_11]|nr:MAG: MazE family transcriptional regulator [Bdellovibrionales bacterium RIFOXYD1_FULL_53_11]
MKLKIVAIGNSRGVRIPKPLLEQCGIGREVEIEAEGNTLVLRPIHRKPRVGWDKAFQNMTAQGGDLLLDQPTTTAWDEAEWEWK